MVLTSYFVNIYTFILCSIELEVGVGVGVGDPGESLPEKYGTPKISLGRNTCRFVTP